MPVIFQALWALGVGQVLLPFRSLDRFMCAETYGIETKSYIMFMDTTAASSQTRAAKLLPHVHHDQGNCKATHQGNNLDDLVRKG